MTSPKLYRVKSVFRTFQGEGALTGRQAVFIRFSGCNIWSGREKDRERDAKNGVCARWCDTDFVGTDGENGGVYTAAELADLAVKVFDDVGARHAYRLVVFTGGEPSLQLDQPLVDELARRNFRVSVETNGARALPVGCYKVLSPKPPFAPVYTQYDEIKVVYDGTPATANPADYDYLAGDRVAWKFVQPLDGNPDSLRACLEWCDKHRDWQISVQLHKILGVP